ncbi:MAG: hypothetical protein HRU24_13100 [Gammaproteobacteria bacterium]|nr:hypothetical protein [Gammaproteobacteria bacterium]
MDNSNDNFLTLHSLFVHRRFECQNVIEMIDCFREIKTLYDTLRFEIDADNPLMLDVSEFLESKGNCAGICDGVCENLCYATPEKLAEIANQRNFLIKMF